MHAHAQIRLARTSDKLIGRQGRFAQDYCLVATRDGGALQQHREHGEAKKQRQGSSCRCNRVANDEACQDRERDLTFSTSWPFVGVMSDCCGA